MRLLNAKIFDRTLPGWVKLDLVKLDLVKLGWVKLGILRQEISVCSMKVLRYAEEFKTKFLMGLHCSFTTNAKTLPRL